MAKLQPGFEPCPAITHDSALKGAVQACLRSLGAHLVHGMRYGLEYQKRSEEEFVIDHRKQQERNLHRKAKELGYKLKKIAGPVEAVSPA